MKHNCYFCGELKETQRINSIKDNELKAGYMSKEPRKYIDACNDCIKKHGGIAKIAESMRISG